MGYSHHWYRPIDLPRDAWSAFLADWVKVQDALGLEGLKLAGPGGDPDDPPPANNLSVAFTGAGAARFEDFFLTRRFEHPERVKEDGRCFSFCKTGGRPYDLAVTSCLLVAKRHFGDALQVGTDGRDGDWQRAREVCEAALGYGQTFHVTDRYTLVCRA